MNKQVLVVYREIDTLSRYRDALVAAGVNAVPAPANSPISLNDYHGLVLTGGSDVNPALFGESIQAETEPPDDERDTVETDLLGEAYARDLPVLAICRGLQMMNVAAGGTLIQHMDAVGRHCVRPLDRGQTAHMVTIEPDTLLAGIAGKRTLQVNSRHHQAVKTLGANLRVSAVDSEDGTVEALERPDRSFVLAVQWHPEDQVYRDADQMRLFTSFGNAVG